MRATPHQAGTPLAPQPAARRRWRGGLQAAYASATGINHVQNEDSCCHMPSADAPQCCAVADGVGGGALGDVASNALIAHCAQAPRAVVRAPAELLAWLRAGDAVVRAALARRSDKAGASTLVAAWFLSSSLCHVSNIGDCRAYRLRPGRGEYVIEQLTVDQTYAKLGLEPPAHAGPDDPARMAGVGAVGQPPVLTVKLGQDDLLLLCSDGLHKYVSDQAMAAICWQGKAAGAGQGALEATCQALVTLAKEQGSHDDVSVLLVRRLRWLGLGWAVWTALFGALLAAGLVEVVEAVKAGQGGGLAALAKLILAWGGK